MLLHAARSVDRVLSGAAQLAEGGGERREQQRRRRRLAGLRGVAWGVRRDERRSRDRVLFSCRVRLAAFLMRGVAPRDKKKSTQKSAGVGWWSCPGPRMTKGTRKIASKNPQEVDERETPSLLKRPYPQVRLLSVSAGTSLQGAARNPRANAGCHSIPIGQEPRSGASWHLASCHSTRISDPSSHL